MRIPTIFHSLYFQVIIGIMAGIAVGILSPAWGAAMKPVADTFINMIKMVIGPVIFLTIVLGVGGVGSMKKLGRIGGKALLYFELVTTFALLIGMGVAHVARPGDGMDTSAAEAGAERVAQYQKTALGMDWVAFFTHIVPSNVVEAFAKGDILQILFFALLFGIGLNTLGDTGQHLMGTFDRLLKALFKVLHLVMRLAPFGAFGGMAYTVGKFGLGVLLGLGKLMAAVYLTMTLFVFIALAGICRLYGFRLLALLRHLREELLLVLGTSSSEAVLPQLMHKLETFGCPRAIVGLVVPTGYSFNLDGTTIYLSMAMLFLAQAFSVQLSWGEQFTILGVLMLTSKGAAAVTGGGFVVLASTLASIPTVPIEGLALLLGVDRFMSEARAMTNFVGNAVATVVIAKSEQAWEAPLFESNNDQF
ncbi:MAG: C4-dicarboxylate transporter DctA [Saprospiraceae bacterium]|nr:C4-dicarboxylate transporter DctA [Saprospiraceae bacterium]